ncbi:hypothetical protein [Aestuariivirga sp.]|uniref:hypothetical protein n=1 Tax=Aestuariivirga sp. TaxID=2650926 RepID=UPI0039E3A21C
MDAAPGSKKVFLKFGAWTAWNYLWFTVLFPIVAYAAAIPTWLFCGPDLQRTILQASSVIRIPLVESGYEMVRQYNSDGEASRLLLFYAIQMLSSVSIVLAGVLAGIVLGAAFYIADKKLPLDLKAFFLCLAGCFSGLIYLVHLGNPDVNNRYFGLFLLPEFWLLIFWIPAFFSSFGFYGVLMCAVYWMLRLFREFRLIN